MSTTAVVEDHQQHIRADVPGDSRGPGSGACDNSALTAGLGTERQSASSYLKVTSRSNVHRHAEFVEPCFRTSQTPSTSVAASRPRRRHNGQHIQVTHCRLRLPMVLGFSLRRPSSASSRVEGRAWPRHHGRRLKLPVGSVGTRIVATSSPQRVPPCNCWLRGPTRRPCRSARIHHQRLRPEYIIKDNLSSTTRLRCFFGEFPMGRAGNQIVDNDFFGSCWPTAPFEVEDTSRRSRRYSGRSPRAPIPTSRSTT